METKVVDYLEAFEKAVVDFGPQAADFALFYVQLDSGIRSFGGLALLLLAYVFVQMTLRVWSGAARDRFGEPEPGRVFSCVALACAAIGFFVGGCVYALNPWHWIGLFAPKLKLVHDAIWMLQ